MRVLIDGIETEVNDLKVIFDDQLATVDGEETEVESRLTINSEGISLDNVIPNEGFVVSTMWQTVDDLVELCH
jgi:hypothetical protein